MNVTLTVKGIPEYAVTGITQSQLGRGYGVNSRYISAIVNFLEGQVDGTPDAELGKRTPTTWWWAFQYLADEHRFLAELKQRLEAFALELHPDKTRIIEFGRCALEKPPAPRSGQA